MHDATITANGDGDNCGTEPRQIFDPPIAVQKAAHIGGLSHYQTLYQNSLAHPDQFWKTIANQLFFQTSSEKGLEWNFNYQQGEIYLRFMSGAYTNIAYNCLERNIASGYGSQVAYHWVGNQPGDSSHITYQALLDRVINFSAVLRAHKIKKGDVVAIYLPMIVEMPIAMLACARIGAIHTVVFSGFSATALADRLVQCQARLLITADGYFRGKKFIPLKAWADQAMSLAAQSGHPLRHLLVVEHLKRITIPKGDHADRLEIPYNPVVDRYYEHEMEKARDEDAPIEWMEAEDPLFILYTSGSTGAPKGIVHTTAGYMTYVYYTTQLSLDAHPSSDILWTTADCGWITGHSYVIYGPLLNRLTSVLFEGVAHYPTPARIWSIVEQYQVTQLYTSPTLVRTLMRHSHDCPTQYDRSSLKIIGTVGEPIDPSAWQWLFNVVGEKRCPIIDTYWQTETGGHVITALPGAISTKPGSATLPFMGVIPTIMNKKDSSIVTGQGTGSLCFAQPWPGMMRTIWGDHQRYTQTYFTTFPGYYFTGDGARRDEDGYYWIRGREDDLMNVAGHLLSTAEIESALTDHPKVIEAAVVAAPHSIKGTFPYAFITLNHSEGINDQTLRELKHIVCNKISAIAVPYIMQEALNLPKTRSGKIIRRILRAIAAGDPTVDLGDTTTLVDEEVIHQLWEGRVHASFSLGHLM